MTIITLEHITKRFGREDGYLNTLTAVDNLSVKLQDGEVLALVGPSGCGKSTLLRIIAGLVRLDEGRVLYDQTPLEAVPLKDRGIGMVFQEGALIPHWESGRSVGFFLALRHREHEVPERVHRISQITGFGLEALMGKMPGHLSGGERQRVSVARALARDPNVFLFDEPFSNIDAKLRTTARVELKRLLREFPVTSVYVTHDQTEAMSLGTRIGVMQAGRLEQVGTYQQLLENPRNQFVATFIGTPIMNLFQGRVDEHHWRGRNFSGFPIRHDLESGAEVTMGLRAEGLRLSNDGIAARVDSATPYYAERMTLLEVSANGEHWTMAGPLEDPPVPGDRIYCEADPKAAVFFNPESGVRIG